jgi:hypothetical protein
MTDARVYEARVSSPWTEALFVGLTVLFSALLVWRVSARGFDILAAIWLLLAALFLFCAVNYRTLVIRLSPESLRLRFGIFTKTIPMEDIAGCALDDVPALMRYGGAGIHFMSIRGRYLASFNYLEHPRVVVALKRQASLVRDVSLSTRQPDEVIRRIRDATS